MQYKELKFLLNVKQPSEISHQIGQLFYNNPKSFKVKLMELLNKNNTLNIRIGISIILNYVVKVNPYILIDYNQLLIECLNDKSTILASNIAELIGCICCTKPFHLELPEECLDYALDKNCYKKPPFVKNRMKKIKSYEICFRNVCESAISS